MRHECPARHRFFVCLSEPQRKAARCCYSRVAELAGTSSTSPLVLTEVAYLLLRDVGALAVADFAEQMADPPLEFVEPQPTDYRRAAEIIRQYQDAPIDLVDAIIVAIAERLTRRILTLDQRHFRLIRPRHCSAFELLP